MAFFAISLRGVPPGESAQECVARRSKPFDNLKQVSGESGASNDLQARSLLKFSGLGKSDHASVAGRVGDKCDAEARRGYFRKFWS